MFLRGVAGAVLELDLRQWEEDFDTDAVRAQVDADKPGSIEMLLPGEPAMIVSGPGGSGKLVRSPSLSAVVAGIEEVG